MGSEGELREDSDDEDIYGNETDSDDGDSHHIQFTKDSNSDENEDHE
jgi:hypothetical protein